MALIDEKQKDYSKNKSKIERLQAEVRHRKAEYIRLCDAATSKVAGLEEDLAILRASLIALESHVSEKIQQVFSRHVLR